MAEFSDLLQKRKAGISQTLNQQQSVVQQPEQSKGEFSQRLQQRKLEQQQREAGRQRLTQQVPSLSGRISEAFTGEQRKTPLTESKSRAMDGCISVKTTRANGLYTGG